MNFSSMAAVETTTPYMHSTTTYMPNDQPKKTNNKGKQKIEIRRLEKKEARQVTLSKRKKGLFKKSAELCRDFGSEVAAITFSEAGKIYTFGHPSVEDVIQRYLNSFDPNYCENHRENNYYYDESSQQQYKEVPNQNIEASSSSGVYNGFWWNEPIDYLGLEELQQFEVSIEALRKQVAARVNEIDRTSMSLVPRNFVYEGVAPTISRYGPDSYLNMLCN